MTFSPKHFSKLLHAANEEIRELKEDLTTAESAVADLMELNDKLTAERDRLRDELIYIEKACTGAVQIDGAFDDTEALRCLALYIERVLI